MEKSTKIDRIIQEIDEYIQERNLFFIKDSNGNNDTYILLKKNTEEEVGKIEIDVSQEYINQQHGRRLRSGIEIEDIVININWINVEKKYLGQKYGTIILIYAICSVLLDHPNIEYAKLDDDSDRSDNTRNIYSSLLFVHDEHTELIDNFKKTLLRGPEKTAYLGSEDYLDLLLKKVIDIRKQIKSGKKTKKRTIKKYKNNKKRTIKKKKKKPKIKSLNV
jgi:hypothetical protein